MQQAIFTAHCPYELGDIVEVAIIEGMAITGYPRRLGTAEMQITDIITEHSLKNGTVSFIYELDGKKRMRLIPWNELTKRSENIDKSRICDRFGHGKRIKEVAAGKNHGSR